jgi:hypothetical protein
MKRLPVQCTPPGWDNDADDAEARSAEGIFPLPTLFAEARKGWGTAALRPVSTENGEHF